MLILIVVENGIDYLAFGPFESVHEAQTFARDFRREHGIPGHDNIEPTSEENDAWTEADWYFGIHPVAPAQLPLSADAMTLEQVKLAREEVWQQLQAAGGRGVELAERIDELDALIERLESEPGLPGNDDDRHDESDLYTPEYEVAEVIRRCSPSAREILMDALRVRAMDFVQDRLHANDRAADVAADIYREVDPGADSNNAFDPDTYGRES